MWGRRFRLPTEFFTASDLTWRSRLGKIRRALPSRDIRNQTYFFAATGVTGVAAFFATVFFAAVLCVFLLCATLFTPVFFTAALLVAELVVEAGFAAVLV